MSGAKYVETFLATPKYLVVLFVEQPASTSSKFFTISTEFDKNISDWSLDYTNHKNGIDICLRLVKCPKNSCQKVPIFLEILENKVIQKLKLQKIVITKKCAPKNDILKRKK